MCRHPECPFFCPGSDSCDYILITGKSRRIPSDKCEKYRTGFTGEDRPLYAGFQPMGLSKRVIVKLEKTYRPGIEAKELSVKVGCNERWARAWLFRVHPESRSRYAAG